MSLTIFTEQLHVIFPVCNQSCKLFCFKKVCKTVNLRCIFQAVSDVSKCLALLQESQHTQSITSFA